MTGVGVEKKDQETEWEEEMRARLAFKLFEEH